MFDTSVLTNIAHCYNIPHYSLLNDPEVIVTEVPRIIDQSFGGGGKEIDNWYCSVEVSYTQSASKAIFRARTYMYNLFSPR